MSWCIEGGFNVQFPSERSGDPRPSSSMLDFLYFFFYQGLMDILLGGENFNWSNNRDSQAWPRIDRSLYLRIKKNIFWMLLRDIFLESCRITFFDVGLW